jgi:hypothetical protein
MKASDLNLPEGMEVYVDMDGVLADFFTEYAVLAGLPRGSSYRDIPPAKTDPTLNKMVGTDFFARLPKFPTADKLIQIVVDTAGGYNICSSPLRGDHEGSATYKKQWIEEHLDPQPDNIYIVSNKAKYAFNPSGLPNILIDDRGSNISAWEAAGGIGIKYQADEDGLQVILDGLKRARRVAQGEEEHEPQQLKSLDRSQGKLIATSGDKDVDEAKKKKRRNKYGALYGPGPYGLYGWDAGYSGSSSMGGDGGGDGGGGGESRINEAWTPDKKQHIKDFALWAIKLLKIEQAPKIKLVGDTKTTALGYFDPETQDIVVSVKDRHQMDIMRTLAHELVHRKQNEARELNGETGSPDENEANSLAGVLLRWWGKKNPEQFNENIKQETNKLIPYPKGTVKVDVSDMYDWYKLGMTISDLDDADPKDFGQGPPQTVLSFGSEPIEHKYIKALKRLKLKTTDIDPPGEKDVDENFADGKNPGRNSQLNTLHDPQRMAGAVAYLTDYYDSKEEAYRIIDAYMASVDKLITQGGTVYRAVWVAPGQKPKLKQPGLHWTLTPQSAEEYLQSEAGEYAAVDMDLDDQPHAYILSATVGPNNITNHGVNFAQQHHEQEVRIVDPKQAQIKVVKQVGMTENFADGRNPQDKGDSHRHGISKGMSIAQLKKVRSSDSASPRKKQLAHWQINMRQGKNK